MKPLPLWRRQLKQTLDNLGAGILHSDTVRMGEWHANKCLLELLCNPRALSYFQLQEFHNIQTSLRGVGKLRPEARVGWKASCWHRYGILSARVTGQVGTTRFSKECGSGRRPRLSALGPQAL